MSIVLGCIGDDFTGSTDLANMLVRHGMRTVQLIGVPEEPAPPDDCDAVVIALKSRTAPVSRAVEESLRALEWLRGAGSRQFFFKYCSTFDSTDEGNIGPVADALLDALGSDFSIACPAFPETGRSVFHGHLFVGDRLLSESGMENHPLTPMTDANLVRVLARQTPHAVDLVACDTVAAGADAIARRYRELQDRGVRYAVVDTVSDGDLFAIARASAGLALITGGSGVARGLPAVYRDRGWLAAEGSAGSMPQVGGAAVVLSGSCSSATREQVRRFAETSPALQLDVGELVENPACIDHALQWAAERLSEDPVLVYTTQAPEEVARTQERYGRERAGEAAEQALAHLASALVERGVRRLVIAGGETSGAVVSALGVKGLRIGPQIDPGVPWTCTLERSPLALALKSGNFGAVDFFTRAFTVLETGSTG